MPGFADIHCFRSDGRTNRPSNYFANLNGWYSGGFVQSSSYEAYSLAYVSDSNSPAFCSARNIIHAVPLVVPIRLSVQSLGVWAQANGKMLPVPVDYLGFPVVEGEQLIFTPNTGLPSDGQWIGGLSFFSSYSPGAWSPFNTIVEFQGNQWYFYNLGSGNSYTTPPTPWVAGGYNYLQSVSYPPNLPLLTWYYNSVFGAPTALGTPGTDPNWAQYAIEPAGVFPPASPSGWYLVNDLGNYNAATTYAGGDLVSAAFSPYPEAHVRLAIYEAEGLASPYPKRLIYQTPELVVPSGAQSLYLSDSPASLTLIGGRLYWLCFLCDSSNPLFGGPSSAFMLEPIFGFDTQTQTPYYGIQQAFTYQPFPDPFPSQNAGLASDGFVVPLIKLG